MAMEIERRRAERQPRAGAGTTIRITVKNTSDRSVSVGSRLHFYEASAVLRFNRALAFGKRLGLPSGLAVRFEPGAEKVVSLVDMDDAAYARRAIALSGEEDDAVSAAETDGMFGHWKDMTRI